MAPSPCSSLKAGCCPRVAFRSIGADCIVVGGIRFPALLHHRIVRLSELRQGRRGTRIARGQIVAGLPVALTQRRERGALPTSAERVDCVIRTLRQSIRAGSYALLNGRCIVLGRLFVGVAGQEIEHAHG
jgi:hypothetical protein